MRSLSPTLSPTNLVLVNGNGDIKEYDVAPLFDEIPPFKALRDELLFHAVYVDVGGFGIAWNDELDLSSDELYDKGVLVGKTRPNIQCVVGEALWSYREKAKMSQRTLAKRSGIMQSEICKMENYKGNPTLETLDRLTKALGIEVKDLFVQD